MSVPQGTSRRLATAASLVMAGNLASRVLGLVREQVVAALFGTSVNASLFVAASRVPTMVYDLLIGGALTSALVPVFSEYARDDRSSRFRAAVGATLGAAVVVLIPCVAVLIVAAPQIMALMGAGFAPETQSLGIVLVRLALPSVLLLGLASVLMAVAMARERFARPSFANALYNVGIIAGAVLLARVLGVTSLVIGVLAGATLQLVAQLPALRGVRPRSLLALRHPALRRIVRLYAPVAAGLVISAGVVALDTRLASQTGEGSLAAMRYATTLVQFPLGLVATALSFATLPLLSKQAAAVVAWHRQGAAGRTEPQPGLAEYRATLALTIRLALLLMVPAMVALIVLRRSIVRLLFERGAFGVTGTDLTALALLFYAPQLPFVAVDQVLIAAFYALQQTRVPVLVGVITAAGYVAVAVPLAGVLGMPALVIANTVQNSAHGVILAVLLARWVGGLRGLGLGATVRRTAGAAAVMAPVLIVLDRAVIAPAVGLSILLWAAVLAVVGCLGLGVYIIALWVLGAEDVRHLARLRWVGHRAGGRYRR